MVNKRKLNFMFCFIKEVLTENKKKISLLDTQKNENFTQQSFLLNSKN